MALGLQRTECPLSTSEQSAPEAALRDALARFSAGVTIVTTMDAEGRPWGFTACAFTAVSLQPPLVLVCLDRGAACASSFTTSDRFAVNVLRPTHKRTALTFATKGADKFGSGEFIRSPWGLPILPDALAVIESRIEERLAGGDHIILLGHVQRCRTSEGEPIVYYNRAFHRLTGL
ncbi:MAG: flavin reductase family protein [Egibacteraceae bacterium]